VQATVSRFSFRLTRNLSDIVPSKLGMRGQPAFSDWRFRLSNAGGLWAVGAISSSQWLALRAITLRIRRVTKDFFSGGAPSALANWVTNTADRIRDFDTVAAKVIIGWSL